MRTPTVPRAPKPFARTSALRQPKTMGLLLLSCATLLTACAGADRVTVAAPPADMLSCAPAPVVPDAVTQRAVAAYVIDLWDGGEDCRQRLGVVRELFAD